MCGTAYQHTKFAIADDIDKQVEVEATTATKEMPA